MDRKQNGVVVIFGEHWQLLLTGSAVPRIYEILEIKLKTVIFKENETFYFDGAFESLYWSLGGD